MFKGAKEKDSIDRNCPRENPSISLLNSYFFVFIFNVKTHKACFSQTVPAELSVERDEARL